jgi:leader peptidase (prepilin peptidase)/N-methyltransferase
VSGADDLLGAALGGSGAAIALAVGLIFGSFANVCIHRIPEGASIVAPRSRCPSCGAPIRWHDNVPILSWILLRARCRSCRAPIAWVYPLVEAAIGGGFLAAYLKFGPSIDALAAATLFFLCVVLTVIDLRLFILPDVLTIPGIAAGLAFAVARSVAARAGGGASWLGGVLDDRIGPLAALGGAATGAAIPFVARGGYMLLRRWRGAETGREEREPDRPIEVEGETAGTVRARSGDDDLAEAAAEEGMGLGDVKMLAMAGAFLGPRMTLVAILIGSIGGCALVVPWLLLSRRSFRTPIPFGPFIAGGAVLALFAGERLASWYASFIVRLIF